MIYKTIQYVKHIKSSSKIDLKIPRPKNLSDYITKTYLDSKILQKLSIKDECSETSIMIFDNPETMYRYNSDPMLLDWRKQLNLNIKKLKITTIQYAVNHEFTEKEFTEILNKF